MRRPPPPLLRRPSAAAPLQVMADLQRTVALVNRGQWDQAQVHAEHVLAVRPADPSALNVLGTVAMNLGRAEDAVSWFERAAAGQPRNPFIQFNLGEAHRRIQAYPRAAKFFQRAAALKPDFAEARAAAGDIFRIMGQEADAERSHQAALRLVSGPAQRPQGLWALAAPARRSGRGRTSLRGGLCQCAHRRSDTTDPFHQSWCHPTAARAGAAGPRPPRASRPGRTQG